MSIIQFYIIIISKINIKNNMTTLQIVLHAYLALSIVLFIISFIKLKSSSYQMKYTPFFYPLLAFVWEDMLVISFFSVIASALLIYMNSLKYSLILLLIFIIVRLSGETIYCFLQQFVPSGFRPQDFRFKNLNTNSIFIIWQVTAISLVVLSIFLLFIVSALPN